MMLVDCLAQLLTIGGALEVSDATPKTNFRCLRLGRKKIISIHMRTSSQSRPLHLVIGSLVYSHLIAARHTSRISTPLSEHYRRIGGERQEIVAT